MHAGKGEEEAKKEKEANVFPTQQGKSASCVYLHFLTDPKTVSLLETMRARDHLYLLEGCPELSSES